MATQGACAWAANTAWRWFGDGNMCQNQNLGWFRTCLSQTGAKPTPVLDLVGPLPEAGQPLIVKTGMQEPRPQAQEPAGQF